MCTKHMYNDLQKDNYRGKSAIYRYGKSAIYRYAINAQRWGEILLLRYVPHSIGGAIVTPVKQSCGRLLILMLFQGVCSS